MERVSGINIILEISAVVLAVTLMFTITGQIHMLQQNSYFNSRFINYLKGAASYKTAVSALVSAAIVALAASSLWLYIPLLSVAAVTGLFRCIAAVCGQKNAKKRLVFTSRVKRMYASSAVILAFYLLLLMLLKADLSIYVYTLSALLLLSPFYVILLNIVNTPVEKLINRYYINDAKKILKKHGSLKIIGVTGSYGKTSTKYILGRMLSEKYNVTITPGSFNTLLGVVRTIREQLTPATQVFVVEMGAKRVGDIKEICDLVKPQMGVITSVGEQHLSTFGSIDNVLKTKFELYDAVKAAGGVMFLNFDNKLIRENADRGARVVSYAAKGGAADVYAENIRASSRGSVSDLVLKGEKVQIQTKLLGAHNVCNIAGAAAVCMELGMSAADIKCAAFMLESVEHRLQLRRYLNGSLLIDDSYNSNPEGCVEAANVLASFEGKRRIIVTPGVIELGEREYDVNYHFGEVMADSADDIILVGEKRAVPMKDAIEKSDFDTERLYVVNTFKEAAAKLASMCSSDTVVLFENDLPDNYEKQ